MRKQIPAMIPFFRPALLLLAVVGVCLASGPSAPSGALVSNSRWPRATTLKTWADDVMRIEGLENASETAQGKAFFTWLRLYCRMAVGGMIQAYEGEYGKEQFVLDAHKNLFVYGWGYCDTCSRIADAAWSELKNDPKAAERVIVQHKEGGYHTMYRLRMDGGYGAFDPRYGYYLIEHDAPDARILDWPEVGVDENIRKNRGFRHRSKPFFEIAGKEWDRAFEVEPAYFPNETAWVQAGRPAEHTFGDSHYKMGTAFHDMSFQLPRGVTITRYWDNSARKVYHPVSERANRELPFLPSGRFYRVTEDSHGGNWPRTDPNYPRAKPYLQRVPVGEGYDADLEGSLTIGQAWGEIVYQPNLADGSLADVLLPDGTLVQHPTAPYLRPADPKEGGSATLEFYSPYVLVDGELEAALAGGAATVEIRTMLPKPASANQPGAWSPWQTLASGGSVSAQLGRPRFNGKDVSIHGVYRFQLRITVKGSQAGEAAGLSRLRMKLYFETGIMSLPQIFEGDNAMQLALKDASQLRGPVTVTYRYQTAQGERTHRQSLKPSDFRDNAASYPLAAPGLTRCNSVTVAY